MDNLSYLIDEKIKYFKGELTFIRKKVDLFVKELLANLTDEARGRLDLEKMRIQRWQRTVKDIHDFSTAKIFNEKKRDYLETFQNRIPELDSAEAKIQGQRLDEQELTDQGLVGDSVAEAATGEIYLPANAKVHESDKHNAKIITYSSIDSVPNRVNNGNAIE